MTHPESMPRRWIFLLPALVFFAAGARFLRVHAMDLHLGVRGYEDVYYVPPGDWLRVFSLGHDEALADFLWMRSLLYYSDELVHRGSAKYIFNYTQSMIDLDPEFRAVYKWVGTAAVYLANDPDVRQYERAAGFLRRAVQKWPQDGELHWELGAFILYNYLHKVEDAAAKTRLREEGTEHLAAAARLGKGPPWLVFTNLAQYQRLGQNEQAIRHLTEMYSLVKDPAIRRDIQIELARLRGERYAETLRATVNELETQRRESFPYMDGDLFLFVGRKGQLERTVGPPWFSRSLSQDPAEP